MSSMDSAPSDNDAELLASLAEGGDAAKRAWPVLVEKYSARMYAVARSFSVNEASAEDLVQTAWLRLLERAGQLRDPGAVGAWLCTIIRNEARRRFTRSREAPASLLPETAASEDAVEARLARDERIQALRLAFAHLGQECQQLLRLLLAEPAPSYDEIAAALGRPRGSLGPTRRRCLEQLRARLPIGFEP